MEKQVKHQVSINSLKNALVKITQTGKYNPGDTVKEFDSDEVFNNDVICSAENPHIVNANIYRVLWEIDISVVHTMNDNNDTFTIQFFDEVFDKTGISKSDDGRSKENPKNVLYFIVK